MSRLLARRLPDVPVPRWWVLIAVAVGVLVNAAPVLPSPGRWQPDASRAVAAEVGWVTGYLTPGPRVGARIPNRLWVAWAEDEVGWARGYLNRQAAALDAVAGRASSTADRAAVAAAQGAVRAALQQVAAWPSSGQGTPAAPGHTAAGQVVEWRD